ncbi:class I SAM-dependent methyltransferase [Alkalibacillus silvisoli]|uniref:tRNA (Adenine(22)-N(1))-methyltransferase TrmK n=1 Tax=Alkalibacillus silvisoli TaxID=392823 RepID=A0ABP3JLG1_9BACI
MQEIGLSKRLNKVKDMIPHEVQTFADIGSDHAYLPCQVCLERPNVFAIAGEVNEGPYHAAVHQVESAQLTERIDVRLGDGLQILENREVDCITIAGMGGSLITNILKQGMHVLEGVKTLVLQPNIDASSIRQFAIDYQYEIINEDVILEDGYIYELVVLTPSDTSVDYTGKQIYLGPVMLQSKNKAFYQKWKQVYYKKKSIIEQMKQAKQPNELKIKEFKQQIQWIEEEVFN